MDLGREIGDGHQGCSGLPITVEEAPRGSAKATEGPGSQALYNITEGWIKPALKPTPAPTF